MALRSADCCYQAVAIEKETKPVISANFRTCGERTFNNLRTNFVDEIP
jgi:hypothetical protein